MSFDHAPFVVTECSAFEEDGVRGVLLRDDAGRGLKLRVTNGQPVEAKFFPSRYSDAFEPLGSCGIMWIYTRPMRGGVVGEGEATLSCASDGHVLLGHVHFEQCRPLH